MTTATKEEKHRSLRLLPLEDRVLVEPDPSAETTPGGLVLPEKARDKSKRGKVLEVGAGKRNKEGKRIPPTVRVGDRVLFGEYSGEQVKFDSRDVLLLCEDDILAMICDPPQDL